LLDAANSIHHFKNSTTPPNIDRPHLQILLEVVDKGTVSNAVIGECYFDLVGWCPPPSCSASLLPNKAKF
jgi:hypothetical protein